ncbi:hypothetical protein halTADL_1482 [Halohasta litchfieldiae]|jgi:hypothetical protein|nr:hypothetical protein [Halohasta litchfieldiae]ATW88247.1 hypothetical protein halTADL_1482 [Halohasta litchfieldiae]
MAYFNEIKERAHQQPVIVPLPKLAQFYLEDFNIYSSIDDFQTDFYHPDFLFENDVIIDADEHHPDFDRLSCDEETVGPRLNTVVDWASNTDHQRLKEDLLVQSQIKEHILDAVSTEDLVILIIVDGLSYESVRGTAIDARPVFVDGISTTEPGYRRVIYGKGQYSPTSVYADLLDAKRFYNDLSYTYWERGDEDLSTDLHSSMSSVTRISSFNEVVDALREEYPLEEKTFVQITRMGLDQDSHNRKEEPNKSAVVQDILDDLGKMHETADKLSDRFRIFLTADHGILWRDQLPSEDSIVCEDYHPHARFVEGGMNIKEGRTIFETDGVKSIGLGYPHLTRKLANTEWGVHGGFSYYESIVPLIEVTEDSAL